MKTTKYQRNGDRFRVYQGFAHVTFKRREKGMRVWGVAWKPGEDGKKVFMGKHYTHKVYEPTHGLNHVRRAAKMRNSMRGRSFIARRQANRSPSIRIKRKKPIGRLIEQLHKKMTEEK